MGTNLRRLDDDRVSSEYDVNLESELKNGSCVDGDHILHLLQNRKRYDVHVQISEFDVQMEAAEFLDWIGSTESYFDLK